MARKTFFNSVLISVSALALVACGGGAPDEQDTRVLHRGNNAEPLSLDPHKASGTWENNIIGDMFIGLFTEDRPVFRSPAWRNPGASAKTA